MGLVGRKHGPGADGLIADAKEELGPERAARREAEIAALPTVHWKGRTLYTLRCNGTSGKGPHDVNLPLVVLWHLIHLRRFFCVYHAGDAFVSSGTPGEDGRGTKRPKQPVARRAGKQKRTHRRTTA